MVPQIVFLLAGQSNIAGRGELSEAQLRARGEPVQVLQLTGRGDSASWEEAREPLFREVDTEENRLLGGSPSRRPPGVGPGITFAAEIGHRFLASTCADSSSAGAAGESALETLRIGLVPVGVGGTAMEAWVPGAPLFDVMMAQVQAGLGAARRGGGGKDVPLAGMLWYQGESDALYEEASAQYPQRLAALVQGVRARLDPGLPVILCAITAEPRRCPFAPSVRAAQFAAPSLFPSVTVVETEGLQLQEDGLHLTASAAVTLGQRLAEAAWGSPDIKTIIDSSLKPG